MNKVAIMQGRLSPSEGNRLQFFPRDWQGEFGRAKEMGFDAVTWFLDTSVAGFDPILDIWNKQAILEEIDTARKVLPINSVDCGKYLFFGREAAKNVGLFAQFMERAKGRFSTNIISIPLLAKYAPCTAAEKAEVRENLLKLLEKAVACGVRIALEAEMPAEELAMFVDDLGSQHVGVTYDIGNATSSGFDCPHEIAVLGKRIREVHIKDRKKGSSASVYLGTGDADFDGCFKALASLGYRGTYTLQAWRGTDYISDAATQLTFVKEKLNHEGQ